MNILEVASLTKHYGSHTAVNDISFEIPKGSIVGLLGPNGAGKTTLIRSLTKIIEPDSGNLTFDGKEITLQTATRFGYLPEERGLYKKMKVVEQLLFLARLKGLTRKEAVDKINYWLERFSIQDWKQKKIEDLSKGMQQKIQFIATILHDPLLLILDEPFSGFDPVNTEIVTKEIMAMNARSVTIIFSTHRMESIDELCDYILFINKSNLILSGTTKKIKEQYRDRTYVINHSKPLAVDTLKEYEILDSYPHEDHLSSVIKIKPDISPRQVIDRLWSDQDIIAFKEKIPSIKEIFINEVTAGGIHE